MKTKIRKNRIVKLLLTRWREVQMFADEPLSKRNGVISSRDTKGKPFSVKRREWAGTEFSTNGGKTFLEGSTDSLSLVNVSPSKSFGWWIHNRSN